MFGVDDTEITRHALAAQRGDRQAADAFVHGTRRQLHRLLAYLSSPQHAEDLVQETYLRAFGALPRYAAKSPARLWLLAIARRVAADHIRQRRRRPAIAGVEDWSEAAERAGAVTSGHDLQITLELLIAALDPDRRTAFVLTQVLGLSYQEAAEVCDCAVGTIRSRVFRARGELVEAMAGPDESERPAGSSSR